MAAVKLERFESSYISVFGGIQLSTTEGRRDELAE
jgi:hypothetical protein